MKILISFLIIMTTCFSIQAQEISVNSDKTFNIVKYFEGSWKGQGEFANGKKIASNLSFKLSLDSCWLVYTHEDQLPNNYKAISFWGIDKSKKGFLATIFDNFHGHRTFTGSQEQSDEVILYRSDTTSNKVIYYERFIYHKLATDRFKMTYETSLDNVTWRLGDSLIFVKI